MNALNQRRARMTQLFDWKLKVRRNNHLNHKSCVNRDMKSTTYSREDVLKYDSRWKEVPRENYLRTLF